MYSSTMGESSRSNNWMILASETRTGLASCLPPSCLDSSRSSVEHASGVTSIEENIEKSKSHWSQLVDVDSNNEVAEVSNMELFKTLQVHPTWGSFFKTFGEGEGSHGELVMGEKFVEGGQAEIYEVQVKWFDCELYEIALKRSVEYALKVFKKGTFLCHLQSQWPQGFLKFRGGLLKCLKPTLSGSIRFQCDVHCGTLLEDGRFAFLMVKEKNDLRNMINHQMWMRSNNESPFSNEMALEIMLDIALGINQLHNHGIVHRDIKASNVLISRNGNYLVADFECSVGIVGTWFWRAPKILEACKHGNVSTKTELFTKAVDIYSYGMVCYEILTGKLPFQGHLWNDYNLVLHGQRPELPNYVDGWIRQLLDRCWQSNPVARPTSQEILEILKSNKFARFREWDLEIQREGAEFRIKRDLDSSSKIVDSSSKIVELWRSLQLKLRLPKLNRFSSCIK